MSDDNLLNPMAAGTDSATATGDDAVLGAMLNAEVALSHALVAAGGAPGSILEPIERACVASTFDGKALATEASGGGNAVIPLVKLLRARIEADGATEAAAWLHHGATSQDILDTALVLVARDALTILSTHLRKSAQVVARLADDHRTTAMVGRTLTQQALPTTFGFKAATWLAGLTDAVRRIEVTRKGLPAQLGGPVGTTSAYGASGPAVLQAYADYLGLATPTLAWHTRRTPVLDLAHGLTVSIGALGTIVADVLVMAQTEIAEAQEGAGGPSSSMPHKSNPAQSTMIAAAARQVPLLLAIVAASASAENERPAGAWHAEWEPLRTSLRLTAAASERASAMLATLQVDERAMAQHVRTLSTLLEVDPDVSASTDPWIDRTLAEWKRL